MQTRLGICQWFHYGAHSEVERTVELMRDLGVTMLRTGLSWADFHRPGGREWYNWQMDALAEFDVLLCVWHTPPSISEGNSCASPPRRLRDFADFIDQVIDHYGDTFDEIELWNEPNNCYKWDFRTYDKDWHKFGEMVGTAAYWARQLEKKTVLGGMIPVDHHWLDLMAEYEALQYVDAVAIHGFPGMWWPNHRNWDWYESWEGWKAKVEYARTHSRGRPVWITETGLATWDLATEKVSKHDLQIRHLEQAARAPAERVYWYGLFDLDPTLPAIEGFHVDENEYHMGLVTWDGGKKDAYFRFQELLADSLLTPDARRAGRVDLIAGG